MMDFDRLLLIGGLINLLLSIWPPPDMRASIGWLAFSCYAMYNINLKHEKSVSCSRNKRQK